MKSIESKATFLQMVLSCLVSMSVLSACNTLPKENAVAKSEYKDSVTSCSELTGVEHSMCIQDANSEMNSSVASAYKSALTAAENDYKAAVTRCKEAAVDARNDCIKTADAARTAAIAKAQKASRATISVEKKPVAE